MCFKLVQYIFHSILLDLFDFSSEDVMSVLFNTHKHLLVIRAALTSTRKRLKDCDNHNSLLTTYMTSAKALALLSTEADVQAKLLNNQFNAILIQVKMLQHDFMLDYS